MIYLAIPYAGQEGFSVEVANKVSGELMKRGKVVFSPISHTHSIAEMCEMPVCWEFWEKQDKAMIDRADEILVVCIDGWDHSRGVIEELEHAEILGIKIGFLDVEEVAPDLMELRNRGANNFEPIQIELD
jgi:hypothetical protein